MRTFLYIFLAGVSFAAGAAAETPLERGRYLVEGPMACGNCHTPKAADGPIAGMELAGGFVIAMPGFEAHVPNITPGSRLAEWSDAELARAIREGVRPDGTLIRPPMPIGLYRHLSDSDLAAVVAYLRSIPAVAQAVPESTYTMPLPASYGPPVGSVPEVPRGINPEYGAYLATIAHCMECHTPMGPAGPLFETDLGRGGAEFEGPWGVVVAPNLTNGPDGLAGYDDAQLAEMVAHGRRPDGSQMMPPMPYPYLATMTAEDLAAIILYLRSVPALPDAS